MDKEEVKIAFVHALKAVDRMKQREAALKEFAKVMFEMTDQDFENNQIMSVENDPE
jgi:hypothetical protein